MRNLSVLLVFSLMFISCAGWRTQKTEIVNEFPKEVRKTKKERIKASITLVDYKTFHNGQEKELKLSLEKKREFEDLIKKAYRGSDIFIISDKSKSDMQIEVSVEQRGQGSMSMTILTAATLFLVPSKSTDEIIVKTTYKRGKDILGEVEKSDEVVIWKQLFMVFAMPFKNPYSIEKDTLVDLNRASIVEAHHEGFFR